MASTGYFILYAWNICQINLFKCTKCAIYNVNKLYKMVCPRMQCTFISSVTNKANDLHKTGSMQYILNKLVYSIYCMMRSKQYSSILFQIVSNKELEAWYVCFIFFHEINISESNYFEESLWKTYFLLNIVCLWIMHNKTDFNLHFLRFLMFVLEKIHKWQKIQRTESIL